MQDFVDHTRKVKALAVSHPSPMFSFQSPAMSSWECVFWQKMWVTKNLISKKSPKSACVKNVGNKKTDLQKSLVLSAE